MRKIINDWLLSGGGVVYSADAEAVFANIGGTLTTSVKNAIATFVDAEVAAGRWDNLDVFQLYGTALGSEAQGLRNWIQNTFHATNPNGHTAEVTGYDCAGSGTSGILTNYNPTTGVNWTATNSIQGVYVNRNDSTVDQKILLGYSGNIAWNQRTVANRLDFNGNVMNAVGTAQKTSYPSGYTQGLWTSKLELEINPAYWQRIYLNGSDLGTGTSAVPVQTNVSIIVAGRGDSTTPFDGIVSAYYAGAGTGFDVSAFYTNFNTLITALGVKI